MITMYLFCLRLYCLFFLFSVSSYFLRMNEYGHRKQELALRTCTYLGFSQANSNFETNYSSKVILPKHIRGSDENRC